MADEKVSALLEEWGFKNLIDTFKEELIDFEAFCILDPESRVIDQLIPKIGLRIKFQKNLRNWQTQQQPNRTEVQKSFPCSPSSSELESSFEEPQPKKRALENRSNIDLELDEIKYLDLRELLSKTSIAPLLKNNTSILNHQTRRELVCTVIEELLRIFKTYRGLKNIHFKIIAEKITEIFQEEVVSAYYVAPQTDGPHQKIAKGKLVDRYRNRLRELKQLGILESPKIKEIETYNETEIDASCQGHYHWLKNNTSPWSSVEEHWELSRNLRLHQLKNSTIDEFLKDWPILFQPTGYLLLEKDFICHFKKNITIYTEWPSLKEKLSLIFHREVKDSFCQNLLQQLDDGSTSDCTRDLLLFLLIAAACPPSSRIREKNSKKQWKPTILESIEGFILHAKVPGDVKVLLNRKREKALALGLQVQPCIIIVGSDYENIDSFFISINDLLYSVENIIKAVDICYKIIHVLQAKYPPESEQIWMFIQKAIYHMETPYDKMIFKVDMLVKEVNKLTNEI